MCRKPASELDGEVFPARCLGTTDYGPELSRLFVLHAVAYFEDWWLGHCFLSPSARPDSARDSSLGHKAGLLVRTVRARNQDKVRFVGEVFHRRGPAIYEIHAPAKHISFDLGAWCFVKLPLSLCCFHFDYIPYVKHDSRLRAADSSTSSARLSCLPLQNAPCRRGLGTKT